MKRASPQSPAQRRAKYRTDLLWHVGAFVILNGFFWWLDVALGPPGAQWAVWITVFWGLALAFHTLAYLVVGRQIVADESQRPMSEGRDEDRRGHQHRP